MLIPCPPSTQGLLLAILALLGPWTTPARAATRLADALDAFLRQPHFQQASWGLTVLEAGTGAGLFATNEHRLLKPASNAKLFTGALALHTFGPDHRFRTELLPLGRVDARGTLHGDLLVRGHGDYSHAARFHDGNPDHALDPVADALARAGIRRVRGGIVGDDTWLPAPHLGQGWTWDDLQYYFGAPAGALNADDNAVDLVLHPGPAPGSPLRLEARPSSDQLRFDLARAFTGPTNAPRRIVVRRDPGSNWVRISGVLPTGGTPWKDAVSVPDPTLHYVHRLTEVLRGRGIEVRRAPRRGSGVVFARASNPAIGVESPPLSEMLVRMMKPSQNLYAHLLLLQVGRRAAPIGFDSDPEAAGLRAMGAWVAEAGIPAGEVRLDEGSGLSRSSLVTPYAVARLLLYMDRHPHREAFLASLPIAGRDGTLRNRLRGTLAEGNLRAKTGTLRHVNTLSGYLTNAAGHRLVFSAMLNAYDPPAGAPTGRVALDQVVRLLASSRDPSP